MSGNGDAIIQSIGYIKTLYMSQNITKRLFFDKIYRRKQEKITI